MAKKKTSHDKGHEGHKHGHKHAQESFFWEVVELIPHGHHEKSKHQAKHEDHAQPKKATKHK